MGSFRTFYETINVGRSTFDVRLKKITLDGINITHECSQKKSFLRLQSETNTVYTSITMIL